MLGEDTGIEASASMLAFAERHYTNVKMQVFAWPDPETAEQTNRMIASGQIISVSSTAYSLVKTPEEIEIWPVPPEGRFKFL